MAISFLQVINSLMMFTGTLPSKMLKSNERVYQIYQKMFQMTLVLFAVLLGMMIPLIWGDGPRLIEGASILYSYMTITIKARVIVSEKVTGLICDMVSFEEKVKTKNESKVMKMYKRSAKQSKYIQILFIVIGTSTLSQFLFSRFFEFYVFWDETKYNTTIERIEPYIMWLPFSPNDHYLLGFAINLFCGIAVTSSYMTVQSLMIILPLYFGFRLKVLIYEIKNLKGVVSNIDGQDFDNEEIYTIFRYFINEYNHLISITETLNSSVKYIMLLDFLMSSAETALLLFQIILSTSIYEIIFLMTHLLLILLPICVLYWYANEIREESTAVADALYHIDWIEQNRKIKSSMLIIMTRALKPMALTIGPFGDMSLEMVVKILKGAYTYVTVLQHRYG